MAGITYPKTLLPEPATNMRVSEWQWVRSSRGEKNETYVCHGSTTEMETISIVRKYCLGRTRTLFPCGVPCARYYGLWRDLEERATFAVSLVTGSL